MSVRELDSVPRLGRLYARAAATSLRRGRKRAHAELPGVELALGQVTVDRDHLAAYDRVCGFALTDRLPATYVHVLAFPLALQLMTDRDFPFALPGLVHIANTITSHRPVDAAEPLRIAVGARDLRPHRRGRQFDVTAEATVGGERVWTGVSTYLRRGPGGGSDGGSGGPDEPHAVAEPSAVWRVGGDVGRRYAAVSGDRNPIHLHRLAARLLGFSRPIAHGMWTKARCLAAFEGRVPASFAIDVAFKAPLPQPSTAAFSAAATADGWSFALHHARTGKPHLTGTLEAR